MNEFVKKRNSLESFVKEQIIGPGAYNKKYFFLDDWDDSIYSGSDLTKFAALNDYSEVIPEVPAYQYSSAILFPATLQVERSVENEPSNHEGEFDADLQEQKENTSVDDENLSDDKTANIVLKQQNYPNAFGLTFVFNRDKDINEDLSITLSYRKYKLFSKRKAFEKRISAHIVENKEKFKTSIPKYLGSAFEVQEKDDNLFLLPKKIFSQEEIYEIDYKLLNAYLHSEFIPVLNQCFNNEIRELKNENRQKYYGLEESSIQFYSISEDKHGHSDVYTIFSDTLVSFIKKELEKGLLHYSQYKNLIRELEAYNQLIDLTTDLKSFFKTKRESPIWQSQEFTKTIMLPKIEGGRVQREPAKPIDKDNEPGLNYYVQYFIPDSSQNKVYVKLIVENINRYILGENEIPQLNKKNEANEKSFFGVELRITENSNDSLLQYNPPQLLSFDEEESFNKLIYRDYIDLGEGYNTSVNWGSKEGLKFICSDFLPSQETPTVDFRPSKISDGKIESRLENDNILSMRALSTLSALKDDEIIENLNSFVDAYGDEDTNSWIKDTQLALDREPIDDNSRSLLNRQLAACRNDYNRLKRNIKLLERDKEAMSAFRTMNTAMFMQLHHSIKTNRGKKVFVPESNDEEYYRNVSLEKPYLWRSFQLAFILLNIDAFVRPDENDRTVEDVFGSGWPERNEVADLVWFPTGGGKTEAYLGIIAFCIAHRRFTKKEKGYGTTVLMRYTLRMLTLQQFQRATLLICSLEVIRKNNFSIPSQYSLGDERITIGLFVGSDSLPNYWEGEKSMKNELSKISDLIKNNKEVSTNIPFTHCPWCAGDLFVESDLNNVKPNHNGNYGINDQLNIACNTIGCTYHSRRSSNTKSIPFRLFDDDIYKYPPTLLFGTVDKFAAFANNVSTASGQRNKDTRRLVGSGYGYEKVLPPELIIQDELHLLLGPLGSSVGLFEKSIDYLCTYLNEKGEKVKPKIVTSTATTRNTDKQIFALFNRRSEIFPKQGIKCDDSFFSFYKRDLGDNNQFEYISKRKYVGLLPVGKTQVWMQLRIISICLAHRILYFKHLYSNDEVFETPQKFDILGEMFDYYHTVLAYYNSLKEVGKAQSQLDNYLPGDVNYIIKNTLPWGFVNKIFRNENEIKYKELTGRLSGDEVKTNLSQIEASWKLFDDSSDKLNIAITPEFVISTNMISVGIDVSRFNTMIINSMPRNIAEYIQASSRVARDEDGIVFTVHHPYRSRDISHYQKFKEFHEKFYSYVEPISVTPFASKALDRYLAMFAIVLIRHTEQLGLVNNDSARNIDNVKVEAILQLVNKNIEEVLKNANNLDTYLKNRNVGFKSTVDGIISHEEFENIEMKLKELLENWIALRDGRPQPVDLNYRIHEERIRSLFTSVSDDNYPNHWKVSYSLREIGATTVIRTVQQ